MNLRPIQYDATALTRYQALFSQCFTASDKFRPCSLSWLYQENPEGKAIGFDAWDGDQLAAHYVCVPARAMIEGNISSVLLSLNTATHPSYQGKGLFTKLAEATYDAASANGFDSVYGVANANSTPGFVRKLGFQLVEPLKARMGIGSMGGDPVSASKQAQFQRVWSPRSLAWRCFNPSNPVRRLRRTSGEAFIADAVKRGIYAYAELPVTFDISEVPIAGAPLSPFRLELGLSPAGFPSSRTYVDIPKFLRPSPLNLIYRSLSGAVPSLRKGSVSFSFLDFDAY